MGQAASDTSARQIAHRLLTEFAQSKTARIGAGLAESRLAGRDLAFARELAFGVVRRRKLLDFAAAAWMPRGLPRDPATLAALRVGVYELAFMRTPAHAAVFEAVDLGPLRVRPLLNAVLRRVADRVHEHDPVQPRRDVATTPGRCLTLNADLPPDDVARWAIVYSLPEFLVARWRDRFGAIEAESVCRASVAVPPIWLRATARAAGGLDRLLAAEGVEFEASADAGVVRWSGGASPFDTAAFADGAFVVQDPTALAAARAVGARRGETVVDYCAAPGTKTTLLADAVGEDGRVWAWDEDPVRRGAIRANVERLQLGNVEVPDSRKALPRDADHVLVDAPCSNTGVLARRVEARERLTERAIDRLARGQRDILRAAAAHARDGGTVVYSTCSIEREENAEVVQRVAGRLRLDADEQRTTLPAAGACDGGFFARLR